MRRVGLVLICLLAAGTAQAGINSPSRWGESHSGRSTGCRPPLKFAAGACVRRCPAGYTDVGRTCRFRSIRR